MEIICSKHRKCRRRFAFDGGSCAASLKLKRVSKMHSGIAHLTDLRFRLFQLLSGIRLVAESDPRVDLFIDQHRFG